MNDLSALPHAALLEILTGGSRDAKLTLSRLRRETIELTLSDVSLQGPDAARARIQGDGAPRYTVVQQLDGILTGHALFVLTQEQGQELVQLLLGRRLQPNALSSLEQEALLEIGNILLGSLLLALDDKLDLPCATALPTLYQRSAAELADVPAAAALCIRLSCHLKFHRIDGEVLLVLAEPSRQRLQQALERVSTPGETS